MVLDEDAKYEIQTFHSVELQEKKSTYILPYRSSQGTISPNVTKALNQTIQKHCKNVNTTLQIRSKPREILEDLLINLKNDKLNKYLNFIMVSVGKMYGGDTVDLSYKCTSQFRYPQFSFHISLMQKTEEQLERKSACGPCVNGVCRKYSPIYDGICSCFFGYGGENCSEYLFNVDPTLQSILDITKEYNIPSLVDIQFLVEDSTTAILQNVETLKSDVLKGIRDSTKELQISMKNYKDQIVSEIHLSKFDDTVLNLQHLVTEMETYLRAEKHSSLKNRFISQVESCPGIRRILSTIKEYLASKGRKSILKLYLKSLAGTHKTCSIEYVENFRQFRTDMIGMQKSAFIILVTALDAKGEVVLLQEAKRENRQTIKDEMKYFLKNSCPPLRVDHLEDFHCKEYDVWEGQKNVEVSCEEGFIAFNNKRQCVTSISCGMVGEEARWDTKFTCIPGKLLFVFNFIL